MHNLIYAFTHYHFKNKSGEILRGINSPNKFFIRCESKTLVHNDLNQLLEIIRVERPDYIIGIGRYSGKDKMKIRLESIAKNKFRNSEIGLATSYNLFTDIKGLDFELFKISSGMGNSFCNLSTYKTCELIEKESLETKVLFMHVHEYLETKRSINGIQAVIDII